MSRDEPFVEYHRIPDDHERTEWVRVYISHLWTKLDEDQDALLSHPLVYRQWRIVSWRQMATSLSPTTWLKDHAPIWYYREWTTGWQCLCPPTEPPTLCAAPVVTPPPAHLDASVPDEVWRGAPPSSYLTWDVWLNNVQ